MLVSWLISLRRHDVSVVDSFWPAFIVLPPLVVSLSMPAVSALAVSMLVVALAWAVRLAAHITLRHRGQPEDHRYQAIRARNQPNFALRSLYLVFALQAALALVVALPLFAAVGAPESGIGGVAALGLLLAAGGAVVEALADWQLTRFKADPAHRGQVMDSGLWRYSRHPNYFGECCIWWGLGIAVLPLGAWWALASPLLMTGLLLKVSGVTLLEKDIGERRPAYREYIARTNAFFPGPPK